MFERKQNVISTCVWDNSDCSKEICLNDIVWSEIDKEWGYITKHKGIYYFENFNILKPLTDFSGATPNSKSQTNELSLSLCNYEIEEFISKLFLKYKHKA